MTLSERNLQLVRSASGSERNFSDGGVPSKRMSVIDIEVKPLRASFKSQSSALEPDDSGRKWYVETS